MPTLELSKLLRRKVTVSTSQKDLITYCENWVSRRTIQPSSLNHYTYTPKIQCMYITGYYKGNSYVSPNWYVRISNPGEMTIQHESKDKTLYKALITTIRWVKRNSV